MLRASRARSPRGRAPTPTASRQAFIASAWFAALAFTSSRADAYPSLSGYEGGIELPGWSVGSLNTLRLSWAWLGGEASSLFPPNPNRYYAATLVLLPGLECNARFTEAVGVADPTITLPNYVDRMISLKWAPDLPSGWPRLAIGALDMVSINELNRLQGMTPGSSSFGRGVYGVVGGTWWGTSVAGGVIVRNLGQLSPYAQIGVPLGAGFDLQLESSPRGTSGGVGWSGPAGLRLLLARVAGRDWGLGGSWDIVL